MTADTTLLRVRDLSVAIGDTTILDRVSLALDGGQVAALVGESGSGKSMLAKAILRLLPKAARMTTGDILFDGQPVAAMDTPDLQRWRGRAAGLIFQDALSALNPAFTAGEQLREAQRLHFGRSRRAADAASVAMLERLQVPRPDAALGKYPHQFSGGLRQRILIASILLLDPRLIIADEPTTALDTLVQKETLDLFLDTARAIGSAVLLVSHDLGLVYRYASAVHVIRHGRIVEHGAVDTVFARPGHDATRRLIEAAPSLQARAAPPVAPSPPVLRLADLHVRYRERARAPWSPQRYWHAVDGVSLQVRPGEIVAVIGGSGAGKTSIGRALLGLCEDATGAATVGGDTVDLSAKADRTRLRQRIKMVFQDPYASMDPRQTVRRCIAEGLAPDDRTAGGALTEKVAHMLDLCGLPAGYLGRYPHQLSGGERQRVCLARALICAPDCIIADEPVSALDLSVQARILDLFDDLRRRMALSQIFISHDLGVVQRLADYVLVMKQGRVVEEGATRAVFEDARHPYTHRLLAAYPRISNQDGAYRLIEHSPAAADPPDGHAGFWHGRDRHQADDYVLAPVGEAHKVACLAGR